MCFLAHKKALTHEQERKFRSSSSRVKFFYYSFPKHSGKFKHSSTSATLLPNEITTITTTTKKKALRCIYILLKSFCSLFSPWQETEKEKNNKKREKKNKRKRHFTSKRDSESREKAPGFCLQCLWPFHPSIVHI